MHILYPGINWHHHFRVLQFNFLLVINNYPDTQSMSRKYPATFAILDNWLNLLDVT